ncbi:transposase [Paraburkholderia sp. JPY418]|nr:transposase [Paraburkholderia youngii]
MGAVRLAHEYSWKSAAQVLRINLDGCSVLKIASRTRQANGNRLIDQRFPRRDLPKAFDRWQTVYMRFSKWRHKGVWERVFHAVADRTEARHVLIDSTIGRTHQHSSGARKETGV